MAGEIPAWAAEYVGLPFRPHGRGPEGYDCWGLVRRVLADRWGVEPPSYDERYATVTDPRIAETVEAEARAWRRVHPAHARPGDVVVLRVRGLPLHTGVLVAPPAFLHVMEGVDSVIDRLDRPHWARRIVGVYRHAALA